MATTKINSLIARGRRKDRGLFLPSCPKCGSRVSTKILLCPIVVVHIDEDCIEMWKCDSCDYQFVDNKFRPSLGFLISTTLGLCFSIGAVDMLHTSQGWIGSIMVGIFVMLLAIVFGLFGA